MNHSVRQAYQRIFEPLLQAPRHIRQLTALVMVMSLAMLMRALYAHAFGVRELLHTAEANHIPVVGIAVGAGIMLIAAAMVLNRYVIRAYPIFIAAILVVGVGLNLRVMARSQDLQLHRDHQFESVAHEVDLSFIDYFYTHYRYETLYVESEAFFDRFESIGGMPLDYTEISRSALVVMQVREFDCDLSAAQVGWILTQPHETLAAGENEYTFVTAPDDQRHWLYRREGTMFIIPDSVVQDALNR